MGKTSEKTNHDVAGTVSESSYDKGQNYISRFQRTGNVR